VTYINNGTGNWSTNTSWNLCDSTAENDAAANTLVVSTSNLDSAAFTPGAITVDGIALKVISNTSTTGTFTVTLRNSTTPGDVTSVTVNVGDLSDDNAGGTTCWNFFKFSASQTLLAATNYLIRVVRSSASGTFTIGAGTAATASTMLRQLRTTANPAGAPVAGDKIIVCGELTGAGAGSDRTITVDNDQSGVSIGSTSFPASIYVGKRGVLSYTTTSAANPKLKWKGIFVVQTGGTLNCGTAGTSIPSDSTAEFVMDVSTNVDSGLVFNNGSTINIYGASKATVATLMTADKVATNTVIAVASTSGWAASDVLAFASTTRTVGDCESKTISTVDSSTQVTLTAGLSAAHSGTSPTQAEVINLTRNAKVHGTSSSLQGYVVVGATATVNIQYAEFYNLGSATGGKRGIDISTSTGTCSIQYCSVHDNVVASSMGFSILSTGSSTTSSLVIANCVTYNIANAHVSIVQNGTHQYTIRDSVFIKNTDTANIIAIQNSTFGATIGSLSNITIVGATSSSGLSINAGGIAAGISNITSHSNGASGISWQHGSQVTAVTTYSGFTCWRNGSAGMSSAGNGVENITINSATFFGNTTQNISAPNAARWRFTNCVLAGDSTFSTTSGLAIGSFGHAIEFENCTFGVASGIFVAHSGQDISIGSTNIGSIFLRNCLLASTTEVGSQTSLPQGTFVTSAKHDQTTGNHKYWLQYGTGTIDTAIYNTASPSLRMTPNTAGSKMESALPAPHGGGAFHASVASGGTLTVSVATRKSSSGDSGGANYNGNQQRLIVRKNVAAGIASDTVLATAAAATGVWETLTGTTASVTDDCTLEFIVDCDGTAGWVNVDDWSASPVADTKGLKYWFDGTPRVAGDNIGMIRSRIFTGY